MAKGTKKLQMQPGTDEVNSGGTSYKVATGAAAQPGYVEVPDAAAEPLLRQGGAVEIKDAPEVAETGNMITVRHITDANASFHFDGINYSPDEHGHIKTPFAALEHITGHGFEAIE